jgi:hypothetical protein
MARIAVLKCDECDALDSDDNPVRRATVCGPRFELCRTCRIGHLLKIGAAVGPATEYIITMDEAPAGRGPRPSLTDAPAATPATAAASPDATPDVAQDAAPGDGTHSPAGPGQPAGDQVSPVPDNVPHGYAERTPSRSKGKGSAS